MRKIFAVLMAAALWVGGCTRGDDAKTAAAASGTAAGTQGQVRRVISMVPSATLIILQIGGVDALAGVTKYDQPMLPADKKDLPVVGDYDDVNTELLLRIKPTAVVTFTAWEKMNGRLKDMAGQGKFELVNLRFDKMSDVWTSAETLGRLTGREAEAAVKIALAKGEIQDVVARLKNVKERPRVLYTVGTFKGVTVAGADTYIDELITAAGGINAGAELGKNYPEINMELCLKLKPDVVLLGVPGEPGQEENDERVEKWKNLAIPAAKSGRIFLRTDPNEQLPTLTLGETVRDLATVLHPEEMKPTPFDAPVGATTGAGGGGAP